jgi:hypothetical protein
MTAGAVTRALAVAIRPHWRDDALLAWFAFWSFLWIPAGVVVGLDARIYRAGSAAWLAGGDPWAASVNGASFSALPPVVVLMAPTAFVPEAAFVPLWLGICALAAVYAVRRLGLSVVWLAFPPLVQGVLVGSPAIPAFALVLAGWEPLGLMIRPHLGFALLGERRWRALILTVALGLVSLLIAPWGTFLGDLSMLLSRYTAEAGDAGAAASGWLYWLGVAAALGMVPFDRRAAGWLGALVVPTPIAFHGAVAVMPIRSRPVAAVAAVPLPGMTVLAALVALGSAAMACLARQRTAPEP